MKVSCESLIRRTQTRVLRIKLSHETTSHLLAQCKLSHHGLHGQPFCRDEDTKLPESGGGRVQWDPERDLFSAEDQKKEKHGRQIQNK